MPELPEVETVRRQMSGFLQPRSEVRAVKMWRKDLRYKLPNLQALVGMKILGVRRRAKYLLFDLPEGVLLSHLGMTGHWRKEEMGLSGFVPQKHDHVALEIRPQVLLVYNDPRRFGFLLRLKSGEELKFFKNYGAEPFGITYDTAKWEAVFRRLCGPIKSALMNQKWIVGLGNIYVCEALFLAGVRPMRRCGRVSSLEYERLFRAIESILARAIEHGGSTILSYRSASNQPGGFQESLIVYGRDICGKCRAKILNRVMSGRSSYYCPKCQK
jgi:formamidopyrimidine-DNA glycosylase